MAHPIFGKKIVNDAEVSIGTTNTIVSEAQFTSKRVNLVITNVSGGGETIHLAFGQEAASNKGIKLNDGDTYVTSADAGYLPSQARVHAIASSAGTLAIHEEIVLE